MSTSARARALAGVVAGLTVTTLITATMTVPATAAPVPPPVDESSKILTGAGDSRVVKGRYLVQTSGTPLARGGSKTRNTATLATAKAAATRSGATVKASFSSLWTGMSVTATDAQIRKLAQSPAVTAIFPVLRVDLPKPQVSKANSSAALSEIAADSSYTGDHIKVGIIDTGIDYNHVDLGGSGVSGNDADFGPTAPRVQYGDDLVGDDYDSSGEFGSPDPVEDQFPDDCNGHGTHVAGIIGASGSGDGDTVRGVAPKVTFGAYRVFGCEGSSATDVIIDAMTRAQADGMDVVNMSLGGDFASWPNYPESVAAASLVNAGVVLVAAAGNSGDTGLFSAGDPAVGAGVISVASYESATVRSKALGIGADKLLYSDVQGAHAALEDGSSLSLRVASNGNACKKPSTVPASTALLVKYGSCPVWLQVSNAIAANAAAVVIYYNHSGLAYYTTGDNGDFSGTPAVGISGAKGTALVAKIKKSGPQTLTWLGLQSNVPNPDGSKISTFSSAGLAADLTLVPTISAPGGNIYSTLPIDQGGHGNLSGTSMATPFVVGSVAQLLEARPSLLGHPADVAQLLYNTAVPVTKSTESGVTSHPEAVFRQGSGLVQAANAIAAGVTASPAALSLGEGTSHTADITLKNDTAETLTYTPRRVSGVSAAASTTGTYMGTATPKYAFGEVGFTASVKSITLAPGTSGVVKVKLTAPAKALKGKAGMLYGGWVQFTTSGGGNPVSVPFVGLRGDYQKVKVLNHFKYTCSGKKYPLPALVYYDADEDGVFCGLSQKSNKYRFDLGVYSPAVAFHIDYPVSDVRLRVINTKTKEWHYAIITALDGTAEEATHLGEWPKDVSPQVITFTGEYLMANGDVGFVPDGNFQLQLRALRPLGDPQKSSDWDTYTSPKFYISQ